jgi:hypothetical protein
MDATMTETDDKSDRAFLANDLLDPSGDASREGAPGHAPRYSRRLSDKVLIAFHHACDQSDFEIAEELLRLLETMLTRRPVVADGNRRRSMESLVAAHERLWHLRHGNPET